MNQPAYRIQCGEIWGGIENVDTEVTTNSIDASLYSAAHGGAAGGDIYYLSVCGGDLLTRIAVADVVGHGEQVSATSQGIYAKLQEYMSSLDGFKVLADLNHEAVSRGFAALTTAMVVGVYRDTRELMFSYAGHHPALVRPNGQQQWKPLELTGRSRGTNLPLGVEAETRFEQSAITVAQGDYLFMYTDGLADARNLQGESFGQRRLGEVLADSHSDPATMKRAIVSELNAFCDGNPANDDVTFLCVGFK